MEQRNQNQTEKRGQKSPRVPIKTYKWEDVRRSREKGGYPWTYLDKEPFNGEVDPGVFKMDRKSKSTPSLKRSGVVIEEITNGSEEFSKDTLQHPNVIIREISSDTDDHSKLSPSAVQYDDGLDLEEAESTDDISQYLDKEERGPHTSKEPDPDPEPEPEPTPPVASSNERPTRAKSEEPSKRKRKLSVESSYSRISLSKLGFIKKLKEAKEKIKVPKLSLPKPKKDEKKPKEEKVKKPKEEKEKKIEAKKTETKKKKSSVDEKPVYIHIPLKPPEGKTDEFSYLEFGEKKPPEEPQETQQENEEESTASKLSEPVNGQQSVQSPMEVDEHGENPHEIVAIEILKAQSIDLDDTTNGYNFEGKKQGDIFIIQQNEENAPSDDVAIIILGSDEPSSSKSEDSSLKRQASRKRAKSAEPETRKRKLSIDSSYSRKSLSKLAWIQKKWKDTKFKFPKLSMSSLKEKEKKNKSAKKDDIPEAKKIEKPKSKEPQIIHIPLKPPPGETDEFSYLEFEEKRPPADTAVNEPSKQQGGMDTPETPDSLDVPPHDVQFIVLTPPSDDEILEDHVIIPDTPSPDTSTRFFENKVAELKEIAKGAVNETHKGDKLEPVAEEAKADEPEKEGEVIFEKVKKKSKKKAENVGKTEKEEEEAVVEKESDQAVEQIIVDEEDGLKLPEPFSEKNELKLKKKVSFKRRSRDDSQKNDDYEDIQAPPGEQPKEPIKEDVKKALGPGQSMSTDEEKTCLDEKVIKNTSLEEDYNKWSKLSDHEYEPVNPPADNVSPTVHFADLEPRTQQTERPISKTSSTTSIDRKMLGGESEELTAEEMQTHLEERFFQRPRVTETRIEETTTTTVIEQPKKAEGPGKLQQAQQAFKNQAGKFKDKIHNIKKPKITLPQRPNLPKFKIEKPKFISKIPDKTKINLPSFSLPRKSTTKRTPKPPRQYSTESNYGETKVNYFDFSTYPRIFKKKSKRDFDSSGPKSDLGSDYAARGLTSKKDTWQSEESEKWGGSDSVRVPLHPEDSFEQDTNDIKDREDSVERRMASHIQYDDDIDIDDAYVKENQEIHSASPFSSNYNSRWEHGKFHPEPPLNTKFMENLRDREYKVTDLDSPEDEAPRHPNDSFDTNTTNTSKDIHSSESSLGVHRRGVVEEIDSDEFFIRPKGISQDNIEVGMYLSNEIREAFKSPISALSDTVQADPKRIEITGSNQSLPDTHSKKKAIKKPKRKKTPHVSQERLGQDQDSEQEQIDLPPARPKRKSKKNKKPKDEDIIPYQTTIHVQDDDAEEIEDVIELKRDDLGILGDEPDRGMYENEQMEGKEQPDIKITDPYKDFRYASEEDFPEVTPEVPRRRQKSWRSLTNSEQDSITGEYNFNRDQATNNNEMAQHEYIIPTPEGPPVKPPRTLSRSQTSLQSYEQNEETPRRPARYRSRTTSRTSLQSFGKNEEAPKRPARSGTRSLSRTTSQLDQEDYTSRDTESLAFDREEPCIEEPCVAKVCDYMGYAVVDKDKKREPPLPPRRRSLQSTTSETKFNTVPRPDTQAVPVRPLRNYSTLGPSRPPRRKRFVDMTDEEKENVDITQYIEIEDEPNRDLQSGEVLQKMRDRPLPAPPRPPRKTRPLHDITSFENLSEIGKDEDGKIEETVSTQTEPLPDDFICEEIIEEPTDRIITPSPRQDITIERRFIPPSHYTHQETVTHASLVVEPLNGAKILPDSQLTKQVVHNIPVTKDYDDDETSEIPEDFKKLSSPETGTTKIIERIIERPVVVQPDSATEVELLKAQKLQVTDLDVERLSVNELLASKIVVSEIESGNILTTEINSRTGALKVGEIELPPSVVQQLFERLQLAAQESGISQVEESAKSEQKKTPIEQIKDETVQLPIQPHDDIIEEIIETTPLPEPPQSKPGQTDSLKENPPTPPIQTESSIREDVAPIRPPRQEKPKTEDEPKLLEPDVDDEPPPRPPQPLDLEFLPSQPPASFYALRAQQYVDNLDDDIPIVPRRRRHHKQVPISRSSSEESPVVHSSSRRRFRTPEPSIPQLAGQLLRACSTATNSTFKRLITHITNNVLGNADGQQDMHVVIVILLVLIAGLILLARNENNVVHHHHWEYFNPPRDL